MAAVSRDTSHGKQPKSAVSTQLWWLLEIQKRERGGGGGGGGKPRGWVGGGGMHTTRAQWFCRAADNSTIRLSLCSRLVHVEMS